MTLSVVLTIHDRPPEVSRQVAQSIGDGVDELIVVLDRPTDTAGKGAVAAYEDVGKKREFVVLNGEPRWKSPVKAWNAGFQSVTSDYVYCLSSETIQAPGNIDRARQLLAQGNVSIQGKAVCSCGPTGQEVVWTDGAPGNLLCDSTHPRPLGFIWAAPMKNVREIGGYDENFDKGLWHDDTDFFLRLWNSGLDFIFDDKIHGTHLHHDRPGLQTDQTIQLIKTNQDYILQKHGTTQPWPTLPKLVLQRPGRTTWKHLTSAKTSPNIPPD